MNDSIPELEALRLLLEQCRHVVVRQGTDAFTELNADEARRQAARIDLLESAEASLDTFELALAEFPEVFPSEDGANRPDVRTAYPGHENESVIHPDALGELVTISSSVAKARGYWDGHRFTIEAGSEMRLDEVPSIHAWLHDHRASLITGGDVKKQGEVYVFVRNAKLTSPSAAAGVVLGRSANGPQEWKLPDGSPLGTLVPKKV